MRISDWSSDVCSSDLAGDRRWQLLLNDRRGSHRRNIRLNVFDHFTGYDDAVWRRAVGQFLQLHMTAENLSGYPMRRGSFFGVLRLNVRKGRLDAWGRRAIYPASRARWAKFDHAASKAHAAS